VPLKFGWNIILENPLVLFFFFK